MFVILKVFNFAPLVVHFSLYIRKLIGCKTEHLWFININFLFLVFAAVFNSRQDSIYVLYHLELLIINHRAKNIDFERMWKILNDEKDYVIFSCLFDAFV